MTLYRILTVRQPWVRLIIEGTKPVENRSWATNHRGLILIHAGAARDDDQLAREHELDPELLVYGAIIGGVDITDMLEDHPSPFFKGPFGWVLVNPWALDPPIPMRGKLGLFSAQLDIPQRRAA